MIRAILVSTALFVAASAAVPAEGDPIAQRKDVMKGVGAATRAGSRMSKGEAPFDLVKAKEVFAVFSDAAKRMPSLFPENSKTGGETTAAPKIWEDMSGFRARLAKLEQEASAAAKAVTDLASFQAHFGAVTKNCGGCHETYRIRRN